MSLCGIQVTALIQIHPNYQIKLLNHFIILRVKDGAVSWGESWAQKKDAKGGLSSFCSQRTSWKEDGWLFRAKLADWVKAGGSSVLEEQKRSWPEDLCLETNFGARANLILCQKYYLSMDFQDASFKARKTDPDWQCASIIFRAENRVIRDSLL